MSQMVYQASGGHRHWYRCTHFWFKSSIHPPVNPPISLHPFLPSFLPFFLCATLPCSVPPSLFPAICSFSHPFIYSSGHLFNHLTQCLEYAGRYNSFEECKDKGHMVSSLQGTLYWLGNRKKSPLQLSMMRRINGRGNSKGGAFPLYSLPQTHLM